MFQPVLGYQDKLKGVYLPLCPEDKSHFIVPAGRSAYVKQLKMYSNRSGVTHL